MIVVKSSLVGKTYNFLRLQEEVLSSFGARAIDCNETDNSQSLSVYLSTTLGNDQTTLASLIAAHNPALLSRGQTNAVRRIQAQTEYFSSPLRNKTPAEVEAYITANVTNTASIIAFLKVLARETAAIVRYLDLDD